MAQQLFGAAGKGSFGLRPRTSPRRISLLVGERPTKATIRSWSERTISHTGTETRPRLLRGQQWGILRNGRKPDAATPREGRRPSGCKPLSGGTKPLGLIAQRVTVPPEEAPANYVPAAAVIRRGQALSGFIGRKERVGGQVGPL